MPKIYTHGWQDSTELSLYDFLADQSYFSNVLATDISLDGAMQGPSIKIYKDLLNIFPTLNLIASGGIRSLDDLDILQSLKIKEAVVGKAIYEKNISLRDLKNDY
jgi:phosphoribosylformimino-5-aminoimidazole carboxamide ribotide isomerase